jgi:hypothetical protein
MNEHAKLHITAPMLHVYRLAAIAFNAAFLFFAVADFTSFRAADLTRLAFDGIPFFVVLHLATTVRFFAVVFRFTVRFAAVFVAVRLLAICFFVFFMALYMID